MVYYRLHIILHDLPDIQKDSKLQWTYSDNNYDNDIMDSMRAQISDYSQKLVRST